jgi:hypothetical protein
MDTRVTCFLFSIIISIIQKLKFVKELRIALDEPLIFSL